MKSNTFLIVLILLAIGCTSDTPQERIPSKNIQLFEEVSSTSGITFKNTLEESLTRIWYNFNTVYDGGGVAIGDINNDNLPDLYFTGNEVENQLYINRGNLAFENATTSAGVKGGKGWTNGVNMIDINCDGWLDMYICKGGWVKARDLRKNILYINKGDGTFSNQAKEYGLEEPGYSFQSLFIDYDLDGDLDVYIINHPSKSGIDIPDYNLGRKQGDSDSKDKLYKNNGDNTFTDVTKAAGLYNNFGFGLSVTSSDLDGNGYPDIYVANDYTEPDYMWMNNGDGTFSEKVRENTGHIPLFAMGTDISDFNNDGLEDIFVTEMLPKEYKRSKTMMASMNPERFQKIVDEGFHHQYMHNALQMNRGNGHFSEVSQLSGLSKTGWSWACFISDFDNDGLRDAFVSNGYKRDVFDKDSAKKRQKYLSDNDEKIKDLNIFLELTPVTKIANNIFHNTDGYHFNDMSEQWGFTKPSFSNGASMADLDLDGDLDIVTNNFDEPAFIYKNNSEQLNTNYLRINLIGPSKNPHGIGAKITLKANDLMLYEEFKMTRGYLSSIEPIAHFGLGDNAIVDEITVAWHDGSQTKMNAIKANQVVDIKYSDHKQAKDNNINAKPVFSDVTNRSLKTKIVHQENKHDDYRYQQLLPHRLSEQGPFISAADVNNDGYEDFYIGGANSVSGKLLLQNKDGLFKESDQPAFKLDASFEDAHSVFFDADGDGDLDLYVVSGGTEKLRDDPYYLDRFYLNDGLGNFTRSHNSIANLNISGSCILANDYDKDGDIDIFVGGRIIPELYPVVVHSYLLENVNGQFPVVNQTKAKELINLGMVTSAAWSDIDNDGWDDLIVVGEWMPITVFKNNKGILTKSNDYPNLTESTGWWNTIEVEDLDGDGDADFVIGNLGTNYKFKASKDIPFHIYANDYDKNGSFDILLAKDNKGTQVPIRGKQCTSEQMPRITDQFPTYAEFADANIFDIIGDGLQEGMHIEAKEFNSIILRNNNGNLDIEYLPIESQLSTTNAIIIDDFTQDGIKDILLAGNMYQSEAETSRADASIGLLLKGNSDNSYSPIASTQSGVFLPYDVKDMESIKLANGRGILVGSNQSALKVLQY